MGYMENFAVCFENYMKDINAAVGKMQKYPTLELGENIVTTGI